MINAKIYYSLKLFLKISILMLFLISFAQAVEITKPTGSERLVLGKDSIAVKGKSTDNKDINWYLKLGDEKILKLGNTKSEEEKTFSLKDISFPIKNDSFGNTEIQAMATDANCIIEGRKVIDYGEEIIVPYANSAWKQEWTETSISAGEAESSLLMGQQCYLESTGKIKVDSNTKINFTVDEYRGGFSVYDGNDQITSAGGALNLFISIFDKDGKLLGYFGRSIYDYNVGEEYFEYEDFELPFIGVVRFPVYKGKNPNCVPSAGFKIRELNLYALARSEGIDISKAAEWAFTLICTNHNSDGSGDGLSGGIKYPQPFYIKFGISGWPEKVTTIQNDVIDPTQANSILISPETGMVKVDIPANTFLVPVIVSLNTINPQEIGNSTNALTNIGFEINLDKDLQPTKDVTLTVNYRDTDVVRLDESKLVIGRYDDINQKWIHLSSTQYPAENKVTAITNHFSKFALIQEKSSSDINSLQVYPNPFNPKKGENLTITQVSSSAKIYIYNVVGELIRDLSGTAQNNVVIWDGKNDGGKTVASGVYIGLIKDDNTKKKVKIAVEK